jgi:multidrug efflux pump subunit AcrA (membrane-fusion protein)
MNYLKDDLKEKLLNSAGEVNLDSPHYKSFERIEKFNGIRIFSYWLIGLFILLFLALFLPWTQNVQTYGKVTTQLPEDRPQTVNTIISGKIKRWFVMEGQHVHRGDTLVQISEVKDKYLDPALIERTQAQLIAKQNAIGSYDQKVKALNQLIVALKAELGLKRSQLENKVKQAKLKVVSDSNSFISAQVDAQIAERRLQRTDSLYQMGIKSLTDLESKRMKYQQTSYKQVSAENKLVISRSALMNAILDKNNILNSYSSKVSKGQSDLFSAESNLFTAQAEVSKLQNALSNYQIRGGLYFVLAPKDG